MFFRRGSPWSASSNQIENRLLQYPPTDRGNGENLAPLPTSPDVDNSSGTMPSMSSVFALGAIDRLLDRARGGEAEALSTLYHHFFPGVFGYITSHTSDRATAEDLTSEVFLEMVEHIPQLDQPKASPQSVRNRVNPPAGAHGSIYPSLNSKDLKNGIDNYTRQKLESSVGNVFGNATGTGPNGNGLGGKSYNGGGNGYNGDSISNNDNTHGHN